MGKSKSSIRVLGYSLVHLNLFLCLVMVYTKVWGGGGKEWYVVTLCKDINMKLAIFNFSCMFSQLEVITQQFYL
jgi:hypothetical protein